jgi:hypothetical protein
MKCLAGDYQLTDVSIESLLTQKHPEPLGDI